MKKVILIVICMALLISSVYASNFMDSVFSQGSGFFNPSSAGSSGNDTIGGSISALLKENGGIIDLIKAIGNLVILIVAIFLGLKYVFSSIEGKANIKESLPNFAVGVIFFYLASSITDFGKGIGEAIIGSGSSWATIEGNVYTTVTTIANTFAIIGIVLMGVKYMITSAEQKADVKKQLLPMVIGLIIVYSSVNVVNFFIKVGEGLIK